MLKNRQLWQLVVLLAGHSTIASQCCLFHDLNGNWNPKLSQTENTLTPSDIYKITRGGGLTCYFRLISLKKVKHLNALCITKENFCQCMISWYTDYASSLSTNKKCQQTKLDEMAGFRTRNKRKLISQHRTKLQILSQNGLVWTVSGRTQGVRKCATDSDEEALCNHQQDRLQWWSRRAGTHPQLSVLA